MKSILQSCQPRDDIITGSFNPEVFTASLSQVVDYYRRKASKIDNLYTDGEQFFREGTYPTEGLRMVLSEVFGRLSGDSNVPAIHRLETAFGGGKTHSLIALTHLGFRGNELTKVVEGMVDSALLFSPGEVSVVGVAGDEIPVHNPMGTDLMPYTLWGEIAYQIGGESLYKKVESDATSYAAPGKNFFEQISGGRKVLIMLDELAQYAARLEAARPNGADQLAAFIMALHGYARTHPGIAIVLTLAGQADAFAGQTKRLTELISQVRGEDVAEDDVLGMAQKAESSIRTVVARDAVTVVPVHAAEISRVLAKRLFQNVDHQAAHETAGEYMEMYRKNSSSLPDRAIREDFREVMATHYPFHPAFIDFLNQKLSTVETFQGTRGVLRVLALAIRSLWQKKKDVPMIHTCHLDLRNARIINEIIGRTGGGDLLPVLNTDVGGADTSTLSAGSSYAEQADQKNPHPAGYPLYEYTWKTVFLHSLVGRSDGLASNLFGITEMDALFEVAFPGMTPPQVETALKEIENSAQYLRFDQGRYYASLDPSENRALATIRQGLLHEQVEELLSATARKVVKADAVNFEVIHDVSVPEHVHDQKKKPLLALVALDADEINTEDIITLAGPNRARIYQNIVFLLVPETVFVKGEVWSEDKVMRAKEVQNRLEDITRTVLAMRKLNSQPENYGIPASKLSERFKKRHEERELALLTSVTQTYSAIWFPSASGQVIRKEIKTSGGEGGVSVIEEIRRVLRIEGELITSDMAGTLEALQSLSKLFFEADQTPSLDKIRENFLCKRQWPVLEYLNLLDQIIRSGVAQGTWSLFRMENAESVKPDYFYSRETGELPFELDLTKSGWSLITPQGAKKRGWVGPAKIDPIKVERYVSSAIAEDGVARISEIAEKVADQYGDVSEKTIMDIVDKLVQSDRLMTFSGDPEQEKKPSDLIHGTGAILHNAQLNDVIITPAEASTRGWVKAKTNRLVLEGSSGAKKVVTLLPRIGSIYARGALSTIKAMDLSDLNIEGGGRLRISLEDASPEVMKLLGELFEVLATVVQQDENTAGYLEIIDPDDQCLFIQELKKDEEN